MKKGIEGIEGVEGIEGIEGVEGIEGRKEELNNGILEETYNLNM